MKCLGPDLLLGRNRCRFDDNIKIVLNEIVCGLWTLFIWLKAVPSTSEQYN